MLADELVTRRCLGPEGCPRTARLSPGVDRDLTFAQRLLSGFGVVIGGSCDQGSDEGAEQSLSPPPGVVDELKEAKVGGQLLL